MATKLDSACTPKFRTPRAIGTRRRRPDREPAVSRIDNVLLRQPSVPKDEPQPTVRKIPARKAGAKLKGLVHLGIGPGFGLAVVPPRACVRNDVLCQDLLEIDPKPVLRGHRSQPWANARYRSPEETAIVKLMDSYVLAVPQKWSCGATKSEIGGYLALKNPYMSVLHLTSRRG